MSKMLMVCFRDVSETDKLIHKLNKMNERLIPDNITAADPKIIFSDRKLMMAVYNPNSTVEVLQDQRGLCLGKVFEDETWNKPSSVSPDGTYALIRSNESNVEAVTDTVGSRTMWYYMDQEKWIVSTSQRAIVMILGRFELNEKVIPWMLSAGNLGPSFSWDKRIKCIPANSIARLDRNAWELKILTEELEFNQLDLSDDEHEFRLKEAIESTLNSIQINPDHWVLPLSGGYDSRALLLFLKEKYNLETITWGTKAARTQRYSDAQIAKELTDNLGVKNTYFELDNTYRDAKIILNRFIENGEGRIDHLSGYMDGFDVWKRLHDSGIEGTIRGDVPWPTSYPLNEKDLRFMSGLSLWSDFENLPKLIDLKLPDQTRPEAFLKKENESLDSMRSRLYQCERTPLVLAALNDLKTPYMETMSPLLSKRIIQVTRTLPNHMLSNKNVFKKLLTNATHQWVMQNIMLTKN